MAEPAPEPHPSPFLTTKIALPRAGRRWIDRRRLLDRLGVPPAARVTLLHAGPGFGKTACLVQWLRSVALGGVRVAWYSTDHDDSDVAVFLGYLAAALNAADGAIGADVMELSRSGPAPASASLLVGLLNQVAASRERYVLVIDDYHFVQSAAIDEALSQLIARAPDNLDVAIAARGMPNLRLGKLRAEGKVLELGPEALGLSRAETGSLAEAALGTALPARDVAQLQTISEGWPAVLQLMLVALDGKKHLQHLVRGFTGEARVLREYLTQEAFAGLPAAMQEFLIRTSILGRFCAELCDHVAGVTGAARVIAEIERRQLLIVALDAQGRWFRYHPLFAEFLHGQLREREPAIEAELNRRASEWFERAFLWAEAVRHALAAGDEARAVDVIDRCAMTLIEQGEYVTLLDWLAKFPRAALGERRRLLMAEAWALGLTMRHAEADAVVNRLREAAGTGDPDLAAEADLVRGGIALLCDDFRNVEFLDTWAANSGAWVRDVHKTLASYSLIVRREYRRARELAPCETPLKIAYQKMLNGLAWWREGDGAEAERAWTDALEFADEEFGAQSVAAALARAIAARLAYERGDWREAQDALEERLSVIEQAAPLEWLWAAYSTFGWAQFAGGRAGEARQLFERGLAIGRQRGWSRLEAALGVDLMRLADRHRSGALESIAARLEELAGAANPATVAGIETAFLCELGLGFRDGHVGIGAGGAARIAAALDRFGPDGSAPLRAQGLLMLAQVLDAAGRREEATARLAESLAIGERLHLGQSYRDAGVGELVHALGIGHFRGAAPVRPYLDLLSSRSDAAAAPTAARPADGRALASLSDREREILVLVGRGMSNKEIGRSLRIGPETVKWHLKNLFAKLEVPNRMQAVNRARGLSLVS